MEIIILKIMKSNTFFKINTKSENPDILTFR